MPQNEKEEKIKVPQKGWVGSKGGWGVGVAGEYGWVGSVGGEEESGWRRYEEKKEKEDTEWSGVCELVRMRALS